MTAYSFGDVVLVPFPFTDQPGDKQRPAVVISSARYQRERPDLILVPITSQLPTVSRSKPASCASASASSPTTTSARCGTPSR
jgi:mRNA interferase MazF